MFDTVDFILKQEDVKVNLLDYVPQHLDHVITTRNEDYGSVSIKGYYEGLEMRVNQNNVKIKNSSLCKFYFGNNFKTLNRQQTQTAIEAISDALHLPFDRAKITRFDIATNFEMMHPEEMYLKRLGNCNYYKRLEQPNGLYYNNPNEQLILYSKVKEQKAKKNEIPLHLKDTNLLRYEMRFKQRLPQTFKREIYGATLYEETFYMEAVKRWKEQYFKIQKINSIIDSIQPTGSIKDFTDYLALMGLSQIGLNPALTMVKEWQGKRNINKKQASDLRKKIKVLNSKPQFTATNEMIEELNLKVREAVTMFN